jgi:uncharacterized integral membrane protein
MKPKTVIILIIFVLFLIVLLQNTQVVILRFLFWEISMSRIIFLAVSLLIGIVIGYVAAGIGGRERKNK